MAYTRCNAKTSSTPVSSMRRMYLTAALCAAFVGLAGLGCPMWGQDAAAISVGDVQITGLADDWSHHHMVFSNPGTAEEAKQQGTYEQWLKSVNDPRYVLQQLKKGLPAQGPSAEAVGMVQSQVAASASTRVNAALSRSTLPSKTRKATMKKDWSMGLSGASANLTGTIGALSSGSISGSSTLKVVGGGTATFTASAPTTEVETVGFSSSNAPNNTSSVIIGGTTYEFLTTISGAPTSGCSVHAASSTTGATNLEDAITLSAGDGGSATTYECATGVVANTAVTSSRNFRTITLQAVTPGATGFTFSTSGTTHFTLGNTPGTDGTASTTAFIYWGGSTYVSPAQLATNIAAAVNSNPTVNPTVAAVASGDTVIFSAIGAGAGTVGNGYNVTPTAFSAFTPTGTTDLSGGAAAGTSTVLANTYPAKFGFSTATATCTDFVVYPTGVAGTATQATVLAYNNLYEGTCTGQVPSIAWAYNTAGTATLSPTISEDATGSQIAYVQSSGSGAQLVLLTWANSGGTQGAPAAITSEASSAYRGCTAPCYTTVTFNGGTADSNSAPYYVYGGAYDTIYVGDNSGEINTTTSKATTPISVGAGPTSLTISPTGDVAFIADYHANAVVVVDLPNWKVKGVLPLPCGRPTWRRRRMSRSSSSPAETPPQSFRSSCPTTPSKP